LIEDEVAVKADFVMVLVSKICLLIIPMFIFYYVYCDYHTRRMTMRRRMNPRKMTKKVKMKRRISTAEILSKTSLAYQYSTSSGRNTVMKQLWRKGSRLPPVAQLPVAPIWPTSPSDYQLGQI
jgi:hypothetical protein